MHKEHGLPSPRDEVLFDIEMALRKEEKLWPKPISRRPQSTPKPRKQPEGVPSKPTARDEEEVASLRYTFFFPIFRLTCPGEKVLV